VLIVSGGYKIMDNELFKTELQELFNKHSIILETIDISCEGSDSLSHPKNVQVLFTDYYGINISGKFVESISKY
jgi:hypothetical protein